MTTDTESGRSGIQLFRYHVHCGLSAVAKFVLAITQKMDARNKNVKSSLTSLECGSRSTD